MTRGKVLILLITPLAAYPLGAAALLGGDLVMGEAIVWWMIKHDQRRLWDLFWSDAAMAVPITYLTFALVTVGFVRSRKRVRTPPVLLVACGGLIGWAAGAFAAGSAIGISQLALCLVGLLVTAPPATALRLED